MSDTDSAGVADPIRSVLLIAYHFPPLRGSSGMQRTLRFAQHLPKFGWKPIVLTIDARAYDDVGPVRGNEVPAGLEVHRAFGLNTAKHLSILGRYPARLALPDRWMTWRTFGARKALQLVRAHRVQAVWSTFPIATAHEIGHEVARRTGLPWIAEFRDPMWQADWPPEPRANVAWRDLEARIFGSAQYAVFTSPSAIDMYAERFPTVARERLVVIENGFDEETFRAAEAGLSSNARPACSQERVTLLHSGIIYRSERDPSELFRALGALVRRGEIGPQQLKILLRASGAEIDYAAELDRHGIQDIVEVVPAIDYRDALREMLQVDGLLILQASNCNAQIPAKLYEYLRARKPILALTDPDGDTSRALRAAAAGTVTRLDSASDIELALPKFLQEVREGKANLPPFETVARYSREAQTGRLAALLDKATLAPRD